MSQEDGESWLAKLENPVPGYGATREDEYGGDDEIAQLNYL